MALLCIGYHTPARVYCRTTASAACANVFVCLCVCCHPIHSGHQSTPRGVCGRINRGWLVAQEKKVRIQDFLLLTIRSTSVNVSRRKYKSSCGPPAGRQNNNCCLATALCSTTWTKTNLSSGLIHQKRLHFSLLHTSRLIHCCCQQQIIVCRVRRFISSHA